MHNGLHNEAPANAHPFEVAGMGLAPFTYTHKTVEKFQAVQGDPSCPVQPGAMCDFCGTGITNCYWFRSADGKVSKVGCDCLRKARPATWARVSKIEAARARKARQAAALATFAPVLARCDALVANERASDFAIRFAGSIAMRLRAGTAKTVSPKQIALLAKLESEAA